MAVILEFFYNILCITYFPDHSTGGASVVGLGRGMCSAEFPC